MRENAGDKRHRITFQEITEAANDYNEQIATWSDSGKRWAQVIGEGGRELVRAQQVQPHATHVVKVWSDSFTRARTTAHRIKHGTHYLNIVSIADEEGTQKELKIVCAEEL